MNDQQYLLDYFLGDFTYEDEMSLRDFPDDVASGEAGAADDIQQLMVQTSMDTSGGNAAAMTSYEAAYSPPLSTNSTGSGTMFPFPPPAPTPEAALPLAESLAESPNIDISLFSPSADLARASSDDRKPDVADVPESVKAGDVKEGLAFHIRQRRRASGLNDVVLSEEENKPNNTLTKADLIRRERRKASNRRAATKCRLKKKAAEETMKEAMDRLREENKTLRAEVIDLKQRKNDLLDEYNTHLSLCTHQPQR